MSQQFMELLHQDCRKLHSFLGMVTLHRCPSQNILKIPILSISMCHVTLQSDIWCFDEFYIICESCPSFMGFVLESQIHISEVFLLQNLLYKLPNGVTKPVTHRVRNIAVRCRFLRSVVLCNVRGLRKIGTASQL